MTTAASGRSWCRTERFKLFKDHQENELLDSHLLSSGLSGEGLGIPSVQESCSIAPDGTVHVTLVNPGLDDCQELEIQTQGLSPRHVVGRMITGSMDDHNTFDQPDTVEDQPFVSFTVKPDGLTATLPPCSVVHLAVK